MHPLLRLVFLLLVPSVVAAQYTTPSGGFDTYHGLAGTTCTHGTATAFSLDTVTVGANQNRVLCDFSGHIYYLKSFFTFDNNVPGGTDEFGHTYAFYVNAKYGSQQAWADASIGRFLSWGYTGLMPGRATSPTNPWTTINPVPFIAGADISHYSVSNPQGYSSACLPKDIAPSLRVTTFGGQTSGNLVDYISPCWANWYRAYLDNDVAFAVRSQTTAMKHFLIAIADTDADNSHGFGAGPDFTPANGNYDFRLGTMGLYASPVEWADSGNTEVYADGTMFIKKTLHDSAMTAHANIAGINAAWGSSYTTDLTSGNCFGSLQPAFICPSPGAAASLGTANGTQKGFSGTLSGTVSKFSIYITQTSTVVAGDTGVGVIYGNQAGGTFGSNTVDVTNGSPTVNLHAGSTPQFVTGSGWNGALIQIGGVVYTISSVSSTTSLTLTTNYTGTTATNVAALYNFVNYSSGVIGVLFNNAPANGVVVSAGYIQNGWGIGTGLLDEDCRAGRTYCGSSVVFLTGMSAGLQADVNALTKSDAVGYASQATSSIAAWATANSFTGKVMHAGIYALGSWGAPPDKYVLQGLAPYQDIIIASGSGNGFSHWSQGMLDYVRTNWGADVAIIESSYRVSNRDGNFAWYVQPVTGSGTTATATMTLPINFSTGSLIDTFCVNTAFNRLQVHPGSVNTGTGVLTWTTAGTVSGATTCTVMFSDNNEGGFSSQVARATDYKNDIGVAPTVAYTSSGVRMYVGVAQWAWQDYKNEQLNWGVVNVRDNPYNGIDNNGTGTFACQAPDATHTCGGEVAAHLNGGPQGDYLDIAGQAHVQIDNYFLAAPAPPTVSLNPTTAAFGLAAQNTPDTSCNVTLNPCVITLTNSGGSNLNITAVAIVTGTNFSIANDTCPIGGSLAAGNSCNVTVTFTPRTLGPLSDTLRFTTNASTSPDNVSLTGTGVIPTAPAVQLSMLGTAQMIGTYKTR